MPQDNISKLYGALKDTYELGSEDDFRKYLSDGNKREALRKELESEYEVGDSASFTKYLGLDTQPKPQPAKPYNPSEDDMGAGVGAAVLAKPEQAPQPNNQAKTYQITKQQQAQGGYQPTWQEQMAMGMQMGQAQNAAKNATASYDRRAKNIQEYQQKKGKQPVQLGQVSNVVQGDDGSYLTEQGSEFSQLSDANKVQGEINESRREKSVDEELQNAYAERDRLNSEMGKIQGQWVDADGRVHYGNRSNDENMQALQAAYRQNEERIKTLTYEKDNAGFWQHTGTELADLSGWNPYNAVDDAIALLRTKQKLDNGQPLEQSDNLLLANTLLSQEAHAKYDQNRNAWFRAGGIAAESIRLLPDFAVGMGPMKGIATGVAKGTGKLVTKTIGKKAAEAVAGKILSKSLGVGAGALAAGAAMVNTVQAPRLASETIGNMTGDLTLDEQGNYKFENGDSLIGAVLHAEQSLIPEAASEVTGEFLPGVGTALEKFGLKKIAGGLSRLQGTKWYKGYSKALEKVGFHGAPGEMVEEYLGDVYSAVLGDISGIAGDENGKGGWGDIDKHIDIALGTATLGSLLHAPSFINTGYNGAQYLRYRHNVNKSDKVGRDAMGDAWNPIKNAIDNTTNEDISDVMKGILQDANLSEDAKKAAFDYGVNLQKQRGHLLAIMADSKEEKDEEGKAADVLDNSYAAGYEANTLEEKQAINQNAQIAEMSLDALGEGFASWVKNEDNPPMAVLTYMMSRRDTYTDEQISAAANYYQTKFQKQGMQQAEADNMEIGEEPKPGPSYTSMEENNGLFAVNTYDKNGELLNQRAFFTEEEANAYQGEVKMQKQHQELKDLFFNPNLDIYSIQRIAEENGVDIDTINRIVNSDPMRLSDTDLQLADELRGIMQEAVYPANEVHTDFNQQRGVEAADDAQIDTDMPNEQIVSSIVAPYIEARNNLLSLFNQNEELAEEVQMYEQMGKSEQEIISMLDTFSPEQVQTVTDFYNAQARFDGFMNRSQDKIEERVKLERGRRTFKGTINGTANVRDLVEITDGVNNYTLLNGNIETTPEGQVANVDGVIIALDQNGDFVTLGNDSNLSVLPSETTLDNWEQVYREQLQINATNAIDPTGALNPQAQQPAESLAEQPIQESGSLDNAGGEAGVNGDTGANNPPATAPSPIEIPVDEKSGLKRYEQGVPVDQAIQDIQNDGFDVDEMADAYIAEAQEQIDKINAKKAKKPQDLIERKRLTDVINYYNNIKEQWAAQNQPEQPVIEEKPATSSIPSGLTVEEQKQERIKALKAELGELFDDDFTKANDVYELVSMWLSRDRKLSRDSVGQELGWNMGVGKDARYVETMLAKKGEGISINDFVHGVWESPENTVDGEKRFTTEEIKEALLDLFSSATSKSDVVDYAVNTREQQARASLAQQQQFEQEAAENAQNEQPQIEPIKTDTQLPFGQATDEDFTNVVNENNNEEEKDVSLQQEPSEEEKAAASKENADKLKAGVEKFLENHESAPVMVVDAYNMTDEEIRDFLKRVTGQEPDAEDIENFREITKESPDKAFYSPQTGEIYIFSHNADPAKIDKYLYHENFHRGWDEYDGERKQEIVDEFWNNSTSETSKEHKNKLLEEEEYKDNLEEAKEEYLVRRLTDGLVDGKIDKYLERLSEESRKEVEKILEDLGYGRSEEKSNGTQSGNEELLEETPGEQKRSELGLGERGSSGTQEGEVDDYLQPRDAEEEKIISDVNDKLQKEIDAAIKERDNAASELKKAKDKESERATDLFADDNVFNQEGQLFDNSDMPTDRTQEGVNRRTQAETDALAAANQKLNQLQSPEERNSRIRGALDNHRRQTSFTAETESNEQYLASHPLTEEQIMADTEATEDEKLNAVDFLKGEDNSAISRFYYDEIYNRSQQKPAEPITDPMEAIETAAQSFREEQETINKRKERWQGKRDEQKSQDQADIDAALKEFNDFLDNAKGSNILDKFMRKGIEGNDKLQANLLDAFTLTNEAQRMFLKDLLRLASKVGYAYIKSGVHDVQAWSKQMTDSIGKKLKDVLGWDEAIVDEFVDEVWNQKYTVDGQRMRLSEHAERLKNEKPADQTVNVNKQENNEPKNDVSLQGDSAEFADRQDKIKYLSLIVRDVLRHATVQGVDATYDYSNLGTVSIKTMSGVKKLAEKLGLENMSLTDLQELVETQIVQLAREFSETKSLSDEQKFANIVRLYQIQPTLSARDNDRINKQQYSTPAPMAFLMGRFVKGGRDYLPFKKECLEPSAGNGMLTIGLPVAQTRVNDIDEMRLSNLAKQGFLEVTSQDGLQSFGEKQYDVVVTNPPFGSTAPKVYNGLYEISGLEHQMAINALDSMKDDGRAAIIIGGNTEYNQNGTIKGKDRAFLNYLYAQYNVVDVINMNGHDLYSKQGTGFPVRMILINGRKEFNPRSFAPVIQKARAERVNSYDELYKRVNDDILSDTDKSASVHDTESGESRRVDDNSNAGTSTQTGVRNVRTEGSSRQSEPSTKPRSDVQRGNTTPRQRTDSEVRPKLGGGLFDVESGTETSEPSGATSQQAGEQRPESGGNDTQRPVAGTDNSVGMGQRGAGTTQQPEQPAVKRGLGTEKVPYRKQSGNPFTLQSLMPAEQADVVKKALEELGDVDQYLVNELGYSSKEELHQALAAEQIDSVAMAINQMNQGSAFIIGDQTGIGKGRQAAALIRYGVKKGGCPVFITVKKALFSDMYRDLCDIGSPKLRPFIWSADDTEHSGNVTDKNGNVVYQTPSAKEQKRVIDYINKNGVLPPEYDYVLTTYDSFKSGTMDYENGEKKERKFPKGKKAGPVHINGQAKRDALESLAGSSYVIMDESHNAGGEGSNVSNYLQYITTRAKGITFLSATFAKRPGNMPIYSLKTAIAKAGVKVEELIDAVKRGGATFQEIMSKALTEAGQMIRRERDMTGVTIDWRGIEDEAIVQKQREQYDTIIGLFNDIIQFQRTYVDPIVNGMNDDEADNQGSVDHTPGTRDMGINNTPFASRTYNMVQQVLLSLKAEEAAKRAIEHLKAGRKPVITVANTNEGAADEAAGMGDSMEMPDLSVNLKKGLQGTLRITKKDAFGNTQNEMIPFDKLSEEGRARYLEIMDAIENASSGLSLSPIDVIKNTLQKAGYKVGELTGRKAEFIYNEDGTVRRVKRQDTDKKRIAADFNNGKLDALILNRSAGTGISLHASSKFDDQRQRIMIVAQAQGDVNDEVQIRGRIDRTGQVLRGMYEYVVSQIPSEQRLLMMLKAKLRSLDANTTSSQKSKFNEMQVQDIINKYGDEIVIQYLAEHPDLAMKMCDPLKWGEGAETLSPEALISQAQKPSNGGDGATASKVLGRMALLTVKEQEKMLAEIGDLYKAEIERLNEMGENDLEITEMPLKAKTLSKDVWEEGVEPGGKNPFADNSYVETVEMDVLRKPMKAEEVKKSQERLLGGKTWEEYKQGVMEKVDSWAEQKKADIRKTFTERAEKKAEAEKEKYIKGAKKMQDKNGMTDEEIERNGQSQYNTIRSQEMEKLQPALEAVDVQKQTFVDALETFTTDGVYALPTDIYDISQLTFEPSFGKVIDVKIADNYSTTASTITFATMDGRRKITIPISGMVKQHNGEKQNIVPAIMSQTAQSRDGFFGRNLSDMFKVLSQNVDNWDRLVTTSTRKKGYIITGNLLKALTELRKQGKGGKLISYTTDTGDVRQGILMSDQFDPKTLTSKNPISSAKEDLFDWLKDKKIVSADGEVEIRNDGGGWFLLKVPKSMKKGEKYFNDQTLLDLVSGQFEGSTKMAADFRQDNLDAILKRLDELGVTVASAKEEQNESSKTSGRYHIIEEADPMEAIMAAVEAWEEEKAKRESNKKASGTLFKEKDNNGKGKNLHQQRELRKAKQKREGRLEETEGSRMLSAGTRRIIDAIARELGLRITVSNRKFPVKTDAIWGEDSKSVELSIELAKKGDEALMKVCGHELTHHIKALSSEYPEVWDAYVAMVKEYMGEEEFNRRVSKRRKDYDEVYAAEGFERLSDEEIIEEVCADFAGQKLFADKEFVRKMVDEVEREVGDIQSFIYKMLDFIKNLYDRLKAIFEVNESESQKAKVALDMAKSIWSDMYQYAAEKELAEHSQAKLHVVEDEELIKKLDSEPKITVYRAMQLQDGKLYPPMAAKVNGKWQDSLPLGEWSQADEHPELVDKNGKFTLDKGNGKKVEGVVYAPYMHGSTTMLNDQFKEAQSRPELVVVEAEMPESELTSGYQAEKSPRTTGRVPWKAGTIQGQLTGTRDVILSRWVKPVRIVPPSEVAANIKQMIDGQVEVMPTNVVTPEQREELEKLGVKFVKTDNKEIVQEGEHKGKQYSEAYGKKAKQPKKKPRKRFHVSEETDPIEAIGRAAEGFRDGQTNNPREHSAKAIYNERLNRVETVFSEAYQDSMVSLKTAQNAIAGDKEIPDSQNAYMAENLMHGKNKNEQDLYNSMFRDPLIETINKIMNLTGMNWGDIDRYVYTKSGLERNREFFVRDWLEAERNKTIRRYEDLNPAEQDIYDRLAARIEDDFDDGIIATEEEKNKKLDKALQNAHNEYLDDIEREYQFTKSSAHLNLLRGNIPFPLYLSQIDNFIEANIDDSYDPSEHDYSGFRAMYGDENGKYDEADIIDELVNTEDMIEADNVDMLWWQINDATRYGLERYREAGMRSDETIDRVKDMFYWYVPMRGFKNDTGEDIYQYFTGKGKEKSYVGGLLKHAKGRGSEASYPISTIFAMSYKAISDCNQNLVNQKLYRLCQSNPNDLIVLSDSWAVLNENTGEWEEKGPDIPEDANDEDVRQATLAWEEQMKQLAQDGKAKKITGKAHFDYVPMDKKKKSEHIIDVRINGQPKQMIVTSNPRMAQALNGQLRFERGHNVFSKWNSNIKNMMASLFTSYSPTFALRNMFRDWTHFRTMLGVREGHGYASQANKYYRQSLFKMVGLFKKYREGTLDENKEMERDFKDFMDNGGITGYVQMNKIDEIQKEMEKLYKDQKAGKTIKFNNTIWDYTLGAIEAVNEGIENNARFATFRASRHYAGRTKQRSAYDAKEITVNFNRKGAGGKTYGYKSESKKVEDAAKVFGVTSQILGEGRIFFNATVQAVATTFKNFQNPDGSLNKSYIAKWAAKYALPPFLFGLALPMINKALAAALGGDDDDPYANLAEWTRRKNLCFYIGNDNFITIPIGQELAAFLTLGDMFAGMTYAPEIKPIGRSFDDEMLGIMSTFSPVDVDTKITKGGIIEDPISEVTGRTFSVLAPLVAVEQNLGWTGRPIYREDKFQNDRFTPEYQMVYQSTNQVLVDASKLLHEIGGGDDIVRGKLEVNPAIVQYLLEQYTGGPGKVFSNTISLGRDFSDFLSGKDTDFNIRKVEGVKAFVQQGDDRTAYYRTQAKYRKYSEDAKKLYHDVKGYENAAPSDPMAVIKLEDISKSDNFVRMQIVREADKELSKINKAANKAEGKERKELRKLYNEQVKAVVDMLDEVGKD